MANDAKTKGPLRSSIMTKGIDRATHRSLFYAMGWHPGHLDKPLVAVIHSFKTAVFPGPPREPAWAMLPPKPIWAAR